MIRSKLHREPKSFDSQVRQPGNRYLRSLAPDEKPSWPSNVQYWRRCIESLHDAYGGICAYLCQYIGIEAATVDHFVPKSVQKNLAYEWVNYRLCSSRINSSKRERPVVDPFRVKAGTFSIDWSDGSIYVSKSVRRGRYRTLCEKTIEVLALNRGGYCKTRLKTLDEYLRGEVSDVWLQRNCPFVWEELGRRGLRV